MLNGRDLLSGASVCFSAARPVEGNFLLAAGQVRAIVDIGLTVPASRADSDVQASLYGLIFFQAGGPGSEDVLRDATQREAFLTLFDAWSPQLSADYNPGWSLRRRPDETDYRAAISEAKAGRRRQLTEIARLYSDTAYYALHRRFQDLQARNPNGFHQGTADADASDDLQRQMAERAAALGVGPSRSAAAEGASSEARMPPETPGGDESVLATSADPVVRRCLDMAERQTIAEDLRIIRTLITRSAQWGIIWRADMGGGDRATARFTCSATSSSYQQMEIGPGGIPPLPDGR